MAAIISLIVGILIFGRDWFVLFSGAEFFVDEYYYFLGLAFVGANVAAILLAFFFGGSPMTNILALMLPSLILRHGLLIRDFGPTNLWPPSLILDLAASSIVFVSFHIGLKARAKFIKEKGSKLE